MNPKKISFIICVNDEIYFKECRYYLERLTIPEGYEMEVLAIRGAESMASGYNKGMKMSDAKYKVYMHQDVFLINRNIITDILKVFSDKTIGMLGMVGTLEMPAHGIMWDGFQVGTIYTSTNLKAGQYKSKEDTLNEKGITDVAVVDGLLIATQYDLPWRDDIFTNWDFYDASQAFEFHRNGYRVVVPQMVSPWCIHDGTFLNMSNYSKERRKFLKEYMNEI